METFVNTYTHKPGFYQDIIDGQNAEVRSGGNFPISIYWHLDRAPALKSKNISLSLWYGKQKAIMEVFKRTFVEQINFLDSSFTVDLENQPGKKFKVVVNGQITDLAAKGPSLNFKLHSGRFGYCTCLHTGQRVTGAGNK